MDWLMDYLCSGTPSGEEYSGQRVWIERVVPYVDDIKIDTYNNASAIKFGGKRKVMISAHIDEIGWAVKRIDNKGYIFLEPLGGPDPLSAISQKGIIHSRSQRIPCVFGWPPVHLRDKEKEEVPKEKDMFIDCGCISREEVKQLGVEVGDYVTFVSEPFIMNNFIASKGLDNKISGFVLTEIARLVGKLPFTLYLSNAVQEEIGNRGAQMLAHSIKPEYSIVLEVSHDVTVPRLKLGNKADVKCGEGPIIVKSPAIHSRFYRLVVDTAEKLGIKYQLDVSGEETGTDADVLSYSNGPTATVLICIPLRYMHSTVESVHLDDVVATVRLVLAVLDRL